MNWIYELVENILGLSHDWAVLVVQLCLVFVVIILLLLNPWSLMKIQKLEKLTPSVESVRNRLYHGYVRYWHQWGSEGLSAQQTRLQSRLLDAGVDWILETCITYNISGGSKMKPVRFDFADIENIVAAWAGYIQGQRKWTLYRWIIELQDGQFIYLRGWFDPGRSMGEPRTILYAWAADTAEEASQIEIRPEELRRNEHLKKGQDHLVDQEVYEALLDQIKSGERDWAGFKWDPLYAP